MNGSQILELWRYPVKSLGGEMLTQLQLGPDGVVGDRAFALIETATGRVLTAKQVPKLLEASARWLGAAVEITLPGAASVLSDDPAASRLIGDWVGRPVRLERATARVATMEHDIDPDAIAGFADSGSPGVPFVDESPLHLLSEGSLRAAREWHSDGEWQARRFRPNILLGTTTAEPVEDLWKGHDIGMGSAVIAVTGPCKRCVMVTCPQGDLPKDSAVLSSLFAQHDGAFGVYADIVRAGVVSIGDAVEFPGSTDQQDRMASGHARVDLSERGIAPLLHAPRRRLAGQPDAAVPRADYGVHTDQERRVVRARARR